MLIYNSEAACSLIYCTGFYDSIFYVFLAAKISAIAVIVDGETQFLTASRQEVLQTLSQMELDKEAQTNLDLELRNAVEFNRFCSSSRLVPAEQWKP